MGWISVKDRLPDDGREVLAIFKYKGSQDRKIFILSIDIPQEDDEWIQSWSNDEISLDPFRGTVTHWMPLPDLP